MTVVVNTSITVPSNTSPYNLVVDLTEMRNDIVASINDIISELNQRPESGGQASFSSLIVSGQGIFTGSVLINSPTSGQQFVLSNSSTDFGMSKGSVSFKHNGTKFVSTSAIQIADGAASTDAVTRGTAQAWDTAVQNSVTALANNTVTRYNGLADTAPKANYATTAGSATNATNAMLATNANTAEYANFADNAFTANNIRFSAGRTGSITMAAGEHRNFTITFATAFPAPPTTVALTILEDSGNVSIVSSIDTLTATSCVVNLWNQNTASETFKIGFLAAYNVT